MLDQVITLLHLVLALQALLLPAVYWIARFLWKLERRVYTLELAQDPDAAHHQLDFS